MAKRKNSDIEKHFEIITENYKIVIDKNVEEQCIVDSLTINGVEFYTFDLGLSKDIEPEKAPPCGCGNRIFIPNAQAYLSVQRKLDCSDDVAKEIINKITEILSIGFCKRCH